MRFTIQQTITLNKKEFNALKDVAANEYSIYQGTIDKLVKLKLIYWTKPTLGNWNKILKITGLGKTIIKQYNLENN